MTGDPEAPVSGETDTSTDGGAWMIFYEDADRSADVFTGCGARDAALATFEKALTNWNCHLFERISDGAPGCTVHALLAERDALRSLLDGAVENAKRYAAERDAVVADRIAVARLAAETADRLGEMRAERDAAVARASELEAERRHLVAEMTRRGLLDFLQEIDAEWLAQSAAHAEVFGATTAKKES